MTLDGRSVRLDQGILAVMLLGGWVFHLDWMLLAACGVQLLNLNALTENSPLGGFYALRITTRLAGNPTPLDTSAVRLAWIVNAGLLSAATIIWVAGGSSIAWVLGIVVAAGAVFGATTGRLIAPDLIRSRRHPEPGHRHGHGHEFRHDRRAGPDLSLTAPSQAGRRLAGMSALNGFSRSRSDMIGSALGQSIFNAGSFQATPNSSAGS